MEREIYYYLRTPEKKPVITVCLLEKNGEMARGVAVCSKLDNPCRKTGRKIARTRAQWALENKGNNCAIATSNCFRALWQAKIVGSLFDYLKAAYNPEISYFEKQIMGIAT
jgi:hypothetical protein